MVPPSGGGLDAAGRPALGRPRTAAGSEPGDGHGGRRVLPTLRIVLERRTQVNEVRGRLEALCAGRRGSRVGGRHQASSDLDRRLMSRRPLGLSRNPSMPRRPFSRSRSSLSVNSRMRSGCVREAAAQQTPRQTAEAWRGVLFRASAADMKSALMHSCAALATSAAGPVRHPRGALPPRHPQDHRFLHPWPEEPCSLEPRLQTAGTCLRGRHDVGCLTDLGPDSPRPLGARVHTPARRQSSRIAEHTVNLATSFPNDRHHLTPQCDATSCMISANGTDFSAGMHPAYLDGEELRRVRG